MFCTPVIWLPQVVVNKSDGHGHAHTVSPPLPQAVRIQHRIQPQTSFVIIFSNHLPENLTQHRAGEIGCTYTSPVRHSAPPAICSDTQIKASAPQTKPTNKPIRRPVEKRFPSGLSGT